MSCQPVNDFISRWSKATPSERANSQLFLSELCDILGVPHPEATADRGYCFEFEVTQHHPDGSSTPGRIDLYKRGCFVLESKQFQAVKAAASQLELVAQEAGVAEKKKSSRPVRGTGAWDDAIVKARGQAERYARALPASEPTPPFLLVVDVGHSFELFADFTQAGKAYLHFPDPRNFRIRLEQLADDAVRERLKLIWTDPGTLNPARHSADVTRAVSGHLAELAKSLEVAGHTPKAVADFLTRCLFCMFAEDVGLIPERSFTELLESLPADGTGFQELLEQLFRELDSGTGKGISVVLRKKLLRFNGGLFADHAALPVNGLQLGLLKLAAQQNWRNVEPAIFGTLLERALNPRERHKLGAHYTPRAYVERLVLPTVVEPLRAEWDSVRAAAITHARAGDLKNAREEVNGFHDHLCQVKVLDPACGSGNFLYVALEHLKRLEGEVLDAAAQFGESFRLELATHAVDPHQFLGIEINPRAATIAELVLWIGYLQWHFRTRGRQTTPEEPVLKKFNNIECRDAVLAYDGEPQRAKDENGKEITVWDRRSFKPDMLTGRDVPDETKRVPLLTYTNSRATEWPTADFIVGNPPFLGPAKMWESLGVGYAQALRQAYPAVPESSDFVMYWWHKAAELVRNQKAQRFGLITTNSLRQTFARRVVQAQLAADPPLSLLFAIPDHPWVDTSDGAAVRIAMSVGEAGHLAGDLYAVCSEEAAEDGSAKVILAPQHGHISADLTLGPNTNGAKKLSSNSDLSFPGVEPHGKGFIITPDEGKRLGLGHVPGLERVVRPYRNGRDLTDLPRGAMIVDLFGLPIEEVRSRFPAVFQHVLTHVKPERDVNPRQARRLNWWIFGEPCPNWRHASAGLTRFISTVKTAKHRTFLFLEACILPDSKLINIASDDAYLLGVLSSRIHLVWTCATQALLEDRPTYVKSESFDKFPFPTCDSATQNRIRKIAEALDAHRKRVQAQHPDLTLTGMYNVLEKLRANEPLTDKEQRIHDQGLVSVLRQLHDDLDTAVFVAYGWPTTL
ncbi:MAG TPA: DNA methyltransferase, partial [Verrucomicrobiae bacterium]